MREDWEDARWVTTSGGADFHWYARSLGPYAYLNYHAIFMDAVWGTDYSRSYLVDADDGFEQNMVFDYARCQPEGYSIEVDSWGSDLPGAYLEKLTVDDASPTVAVGSAEARRIVVGRFYRSQIIVRSPNNLDGFRWKYYEQIDRDRVRLNGDSGSFPDESSNFRRGTIGTCSTCYKNW